MVYLLYLVDIQLFMVGIQQKLVSTNPPKAIDLTVEFLRLRIILYWPNNQNIAIEGNGEIMQLN